MGAKLTTSQKVSLLQQVDAGKKVSEICRQAGISRKTFYKWKGRFEKAPEFQKFSSLQPQKPQAFRNPKRIPSNIEKLILKIVEDQPELSSHKIAAIVKDLDIGHHGVQNVLLRYGLNTYEKRLAYRQSKLEKPESKRAKWLSPQERLIALEQVLKEKRPVSAVCRNFGISRKTFYKWLKRFSDESLDKFERVKDRAWEISHHPRKLGEELEKLILEIVATSPGLSVHEVYQQLPRVDGRPVVGHHGVQSVLLRHGLNTMDRRYAWAGIPKPAVVPAIPIPEFAPPLEKLWWQISPFKTIPKISFPTAFLVFLFGGLLFALFQWLRILTAAGPKLLPGFLFASTALFFGLIFFLYSLKYYLTIVGVLSFPGGQKDLAEGKIKSLGLVAEPPATLERQPFVSIHLPLYNEKKVVERILTACADIEYPNFEVVVADDSTDETTEIIKKFISDQNLESKIKLIHRADRTGFKGGALQEALKQTDPQAEYIVVLDADFIPYPDTIEQFLKYFQLAQSSGKGKVAVVQGYQWHVLNKSENWITRGVRSEFSGSYVVERAGTELYGGLKMIAGSVYMIKRKILERIGWGTSITEDFQLTLKLYEAGYKVCYTPYIQTPSECVSTIRRLIRQRMRWAEGHTFNIKKMFGRLFFSPNLTFFEKLEFFYLAPYYLQATFFLLGSLAWFVSEVVFHARLPFWSATFGWSLVLTNLLALPLMNLTGLFLEEGERKDFLGTLSFVLMTYILVPFQAYAAVKGLVESQEGPWFRTPKTGLITDIFGRAQLQRLWKKIFPFKKPALAPVGTKQAILQNNYLALATANSQFNNFAIRSHQARWVSKAVFALLLALTVTVFQATKGVPEVFATNPATTQYLWNDTTTTLTGAWVLESTVDTQSSNTTISMTRNLAIGNYQFIPDSANSSSGTKCGSSPNGNGWILNTPFGDSGGSIASGAWTFFIYESDNALNRAGHIDVCVYSIAVSGGSITGTPTLLFQSQGDGSWSTTDTLVNDISQITQTTSSQSQFNITAGKYLYIQYWLDNTTKINEDAVTETFYTGETGTEDPYVLMPTITIPENAIVFLAAVPLIPYLVNLYLKRSKQKKYLLIKSG